MSSGIYKISNIITNKVYIGSAINIKNRWYKHTTALNKNKHHSIKLQRSYNKHGKDNFIYEIIKECDKNQLLILEQYYIDLYDSYNNGYNSTPIAGNSSGRIVSAKTRKKIGKGQIGRIKSEEAKDNISKSLKGKYTGSSSHKYNTCWIIKNNIEKVINKKELESYLKKGWNRGRISRPATKESIKKRITKISKKIKQLTKDDVLIKEWPSLKACQDALGIKTNRISTVLHKKGKTAGGFKFEFA